jgi:AraC family transcriptional regulator of adaptative response/methylated-DNA-[protein]-cysteine methyltransferase
MSSLDYARIEKAIRYLDENAARQPDLKEIASEVGMSEFHFQRLFRRWAGVTPKRFLQFITARKARELLVNRSALDATYELGLSSPSRLHDLLVSVSAVTPGELRRQGAGLEIEWGSHETPFGDCFIATTPRGVCELAFISESEPADLAAKLALRWKAARVEQNQESTGALIRRIFDPAPGDDSIPVLLGGTNFQIQVWQALLRIPPSSVTSYGEIARTIGSPAASRAVGSAIGANRIAYLIPCHRVIRGTSGFGGYRWGVTRKRAMLAWEALAGDRVGSGEEEEANTDTGEVRSRPEEGDVR